MLKKSGFVIINLGAHQVGLHDAEGQELLPCVYDEVLDYDEDGYIRFLRDGVYATIDLQGKICSPLDRGLTHLGVFHQGTARARRANQWALVRPDGEAVTPWVYGSITAYRYKTKDYRAYKAPEGKGRLTPQGEFTPDAPPQPQPAPQPVPKPNPAPKPAPQPAPKPEPKPVPKPKPTPKPKPKPVPKPKQVFDVEAFVLRLKYMMKVGYQGCSFYYLDTDAPIDVKKIYKKGRILQAGRYIDVTDHLGRPVCRTRFLIVSPKLPTSKELTDNRGKPADCPPFKGHLISPEQVFLVRDVYSYAGVTQVLLYRCPRAAMRLIQQHHIAPNALKLTDSELEPLHLVARHDLERCLGEVVHGISLSPYWQKQMFLPPGLDADFEPVPVQLEPTAPATGLTEFYNRFYLFEGEYGWQEKDFMKTEEPSNS